MLIVEATTTDRSRTAAARPAPPVEAVVIRFECRRGTRAPVTFRIARGETATVGRRGSGGVEIDDSTVSLRHARIAWTDDGLELEDLGSKNGTWCKHLALDEGESMPFGSDDRVDFGKASFRVRLFDADGARLPVREVPPTSVAVADGRAPGAAEGTIDVRRERDGTLTVIVGGLGSDDPDVAARARRRVGWFYEPFVRNYVRCRVCPAYRIPLEEADEIAQEAWASCLATLERGFTYDASRSFRGWLATVCHNHGKAWLRREVRPDRVRVADSIVEDVPADEIEMSAWDEYQRTLLAAGIEELRRELQGPSERKRRFKQEVLERYVLREMPRTQVKAFAPELGETDANVRQMARRLRLRIKHHCRTLDAALEGRLLISGDED